MNTFPTRTLIFIFFSTMLSSSNVYSQVIKKLGLEHNVSRCIEKSYYNTPASLVLLSTNEYVFDQSGALKMMYETNNQMNAKTIWVYTKNYDRQYNEDGDLILEFQYEFPNDSTTVFILENDMNSIRDSSIIINEGISYNYSSRGFSKSHRKFDDKGNVISSIKLSEGGDTLQKIVTSYLSFNDNNNWTSKESSFYLKNGQIKYLKIDREYQYLNEYKLEDFNEIETTNLSYDKSNLDYFSDSELDELQNKKFFNLDYFFEFVYTSMSSEDRMYKLGHVRIMDLDSKCQYYNHHANVKWSKNCGYEGFIESQNLVPVLTGKTKDINGIECHEYYVVKDENIKEYYYVDKSMKFINYGKFDVDLPGFVIMSKRFWKGEYYEWTVSSKQVDYPAEYIECLNPFFKEIR